MNHLAINEDIWYLSLNDHASSNNLIADTNTNNCSGLNCEKLMLNLTADELTAYSTFALVTVTVLLVIVGTITAKILFKQTEELKRSVDNSAKEFIALNRAWISFEVEFSEYNDAHPSPIRFDDGGMYLTLKFKLRNVGNQPAFDVSPHYKICFSDRHPKELGTLHKEFCEDIKNHNFPLGFAIFPGDSEKIFYLTCSLSQSEIKANLEKKLAMFERNTTAISLPLISVIAIGCINYKSTLSVNNKYHQTGFAYHISATQADNGKMTLSGNLLPVQKEPIHIEHLRLSPVLIGYQFFFAD